MKLKHLIAAILMLISTVGFAQQNDNLLIPFRQGNLWGYAYADKTIAIKPMYTDAKWFSNGYAAVRKGNRYGYIDRTGKVVIPFRFYDAKPFMKGYYDTEGKHVAGNKVVQNLDSVLFAGAVVRNNGYEKCIDTKGRILSKCPAISENIPGNRKPIISVTTEKVYSLPSNINVYDKILDDYTISGDANTYYIAIKNNRYGVINNTFTTVVPFEYDDIKKVNLDEAIYLQVKKSDKIGLLYPNGTINIPVQSNSLSYIMPNNEKSIYIIETQNDVAMLKDINQKNIFENKFKEIVYDENGGFIVTTSENSKGYYFLRNGKMLNPNYADIKSVRNGNYLWVKTKNGKAGYINADGVEYFEE
jgi:hypothetical protein